MDIKYILNYIPKRFHNQLNIMRDYSLIAKSETTSVMGENWVTCIHNT